MATKSTIRTVSNAVFQEHVNALEKNYQLFQKFQGQGDILDAITTSEEGQNLGKKWPDAFVYVAKLHGADPSELIETLREFPQTPAVMSAIASLTGMPAGGSTGSV